MLGKVGHMYFVAYMCPKTHRAIRTSELLRISSRHLHPSRGTSCPNRPQLSARRGELHTCSAARTSPSSLKCACSTTRRSRPRTRGRRTRQRRRACRTARPAPQSPMPTRPASPSWARWKPTMCPHGHGVGSPTSTTARCSAPPTTEPRATSSV